MKLLFKSGLALTMATILLGVLGLYENISEAKSDERLENSVIIWIKDSELRVKNNIKKLKTLDNGLSVFSYKFHHDTNTYVGLMADDVARHKQFKRHVVHMGDGFFTIDYEKIGLHQVTLDQWNTDGVSAMRSATNIAHSENNR